MTRRRFITVSGALLGLSAVPDAAAATTACGETVTWHGIALGASAQMRVIHCDSNEGRRILEAAVAELRRLEKIFSVYDETSYLSQLNRQGFLTFPPPELVEVLSTSLSLARISGGAFDPGIQVLWNHHSQPKTARQPLQEVVRRVGYRSIDVSTREVRLEKNAMALSFNGIAQGYITDRIAMFLKEAGLNDLLIDCGEVYGAGRHPSGRNWQVALAGNPDSPISCQNQAIATSSGETVAPGMSGVKSHLFDPLTGACIRRYKSLSVRAPSAILADGLSTTLGVLEEESWNDTLRALYGHDVLVCGVRQMGP